MVYPGLAVRGQANALYFYSLPVQADSIAVLGDSTVKPNAPSKQDTARSVQAKNPRKTSRPAIFTGPLYLRNEHTGFWPKAGRAEMFIGGVEVIGMISLIAMPKEVTKWQDDWVQSISRNWKRTFTQPPVMDTDEAWLNWIAHPVIGTWYYNSVRSQNAKWWESFLWSLAQSTFWEYVIEGMAEQPSIQDLWITPVIGSALGEPIHQATLAMRRNGYTLAEKITVTVINPMFIVNNGYRTPLSFRKKELVKF